MYVLGFEYRTPLKLELFVLYLRVLPHTLLATNIRLAFVGFNFTFDMCMCQHQ